MLQPGLLPSRGNAAAVLEEARPGFLAPLLENPLLGSCAIQFPLRRSRRNFSVNFSFTSHVNRKFSRYGQEESTSAYSSRSSQGCAKLDFAQTVDIEVLREERGSSAPVYKLRCKMPRVIRYDRQNGRPEYRRFPSRGGTNCGRIGGTPAGRVRQRHRTNPVVLSLGRQAPASRRVPDDHQDE